MKNGKIVQVMGPVIDVEFEDELPKIKDALEVELDGKKLVMEVSQHIGGNCVRCIMLAASEGLCKDMEVINTGDAIKVPVGDKTLCRLFNVVGQTIDLIALIMKNIGLFTANRLHLKSKVPM